MYRKARGQSRAVQRLNVWDILGYLIIALLTLLCFAPFYMMFINATHENSLINSTFQVLPGRYLAHNYMRFTTVASVWRGLYNSAFIAVLTTLGAVYVSGLTAYGFAKYRFRLNGGLFWVLLATMMLPAQLGVIGVFQLMTSLKLLDSHFALIIPACANAGAVFFIRQYIIGYFPDSLMESGRIDGCGELRIFHQIGLPIIAPALATQAIFIFIGAWNNFIGPLILLFSASKFPMPILIQQMTGSMGQDMGVIYLGVSISVIPILLAFAVCSRFILRGLTVGAVKG